MSKRISLIGVAALCFAVAAVPAFAGKVSATISLSAPLSTSASAPGAGGSVSFSVNATAVKQSDLSYLWVTNACYQNGKLVYAKDQAVKNPGLAGTAGPFALDWSGGGAAQCTAYVWLFPSSSKPLSGATVTYSVTG